MSYLFLDVAYLSACRAMRKPTVSVVMSVHNDATFLRQSIQSIRDQRFSDYEFIIVNDGSTDGSAEIIENFRDDDRLVVLTQENKGLAKSLNLALRRATGRYVARQDGDDVSHPARLARQVAFLDAFSDIALVGTGVSLVDDDGTPLRDYVYPTDHEDLRALLLSTFNPLPHSTIMFRRDAVMALGGYDETFPKAQDYDLHLRLVEHQRIASIPEPLVSLRYRVDSLTFSGVEAQQLKYVLLARARAAMSRESAADPARSSAWPEFVRFFSAWFDTSQLPARFAAGKCRRVAEIHWRRRRYVAAVEALLRFMWLDPAWLVRRRFGLHAVYWDREVERRVLGMATDWVRAKHAAPPAALPDRKSISDVQL